MTEPVSHIVYYQTDHGAEIYPRSLRFTSAEEKSWREVAVRFILGQFDPSSGNHEILPEGIREIARGDKPEQWLGDKENHARANRWIRDQLTEALLTLRIVNEILTVWFGSPNWGNQPHVLDELVFILLTRRSKIEDAIQHLAAIRERFVDWDAVVDSHPRDLKAVIMGGGLEDHKVKFIQGALAGIRKEFGRIQEADLARMTDQELDRFLQGLPGLGPKSSACILMYSRGTDIFPADTHCIRALTRLGVFEPLHFGWTQEDHKQAESDLRILIPPHMRGDLHRNLVALGREVCKPRKPFCQGCEIRKFCRHYRCEQQTMAVERTHPTAIDVFSGAGGFSLGLEQAGFDIVAAIDNDPNAIRTYRLNHPWMRDEAVIEHDAREVDVEELAALLGDRGLDLLVGGPPCQGFSLMGNRVPHKFKNGQKRFGPDYRFEDDDRNHLFQAIIKLAQRLKPRYVVIENVPGLGSAEIQEKSFAEYIAERLTTAKYRVKVLRLEAVDFRIPQRRHRYFIVGMRYGEVIPDLERLGPAIPEEEYIALKHALFDLPPLDTADGRWVTEHNDPAGLDRALSGPYLDRFDIRGTTRILFNHVTRYNNEDDVTLYSHLRQGETYAGLVERLKKKTGEQPHFAKYSTRSFKDKYYRLMWEGQSKTIVSHLRKDGNSFVHPLQARTLSVREAARLQSFPDEYIFCGSRGPQFVQIGNAVPPVMARAIGEVLIDAIRQQENEPVTEPTADAAAQFSPGDKPE
jgi:DNA (cytosine-5)-methyltransferase 1